jgi:hypothetical protein
MEEHEKNDRSEVSHDILFSTRAATNEPDRRWVGSTEPRILRL